MLRQLLVGSPGSNPGSSIGRRLVAPVAVALGLIVAVATTWAGGQSESSEATEASQTGKTSQEAPMLAKLVARGELPPVEDRLPRSPRVAARISPDLLDQKIGRYGGTLRMLRARPDWSSEIFYITHEELLHAEGIAAENPVPNILESFEASDDYRQFTMALREGMRWSDGTAVTTEDIRFAYEDVALHDKLTPSPIAWMRDGASADGEAMKLDVIDDYTFRVTFPSTYGGFPAQLTRIFWRGYTDLLKPAHYLKQYHADYSSMDDMQAELSEEGMSNWWELFLKRDITDWDVSHPNAIGFPSLRPWLPVDSSATGMTYERNPYYFKVDAEGQQLPYIDRIDNVLIDDGEIANLEAMAGELDYLYNHAQLRKYPIYKENEQNGGYRTRIMRMHSNITLYFNFTYGDPVWRNIAQDIRFRRAVNHALDRDRFIETIFLGQVGPTERIPSAHNVDKANELLDEMGLDERTSDGWRLRPDGKPLEILWEADTWLANFGEWAELLAEDLKQVGIRVRVKNIESALWSRRVADNEIQMVVRVFHSPVWWGYGWDGFKYGGPLWQNWWTNRGQASAESSGSMEEPPQAVKQLLGDIDRLMFVPPENREQLIDGIWQNIRENLWWLEITDSRINAYLSSNDLGNVIDEGFANLALFLGHVWYFEE